MVAAASEGGAIRLSPATLFLWVSLIFVTAVAVGNFGLNEDLPMALCAGRDVMAGNLGQPDQWSFVTHGAVWVNQGWLSGLVFYLSYVSLGEVGPIVVKALLLIITLLVILFRCRLLGISTNITLTYLIIGLSGVGLLMSIRAENFAILALILCGALVTAPSCMGISRQLGSLLVILIWSNAHGSFMIGFAMVGLKALVEIIRSRILGTISLQKESPHGGYLGELPLLMGAKDPTLESPPTQTEREFVQSPVRFHYEALTWLLTVVLCIPVMAFANPFGLANLTMPFRQTGSEAFTRVAGLWQPLLTLSHGLRFYGAEAAWPFLLVTITIVILLFATIVKAGPMRLAACLIGSKAVIHQGDILTDIVLCFFLIGLTFFFGRAVLFAGLAEIPLAALLTQTWAQLLTHWVQKHAKSTTYYSVAHWFSGIASGCVSVVCGLFFVTQTVTPLLPNNPLFHGTSLIHIILGPLSANSQGLIRFAKENRIRGRVFSNWGFADVLLLHVPDVQILIDCRAQSIYSDDVLRQYDAIMGVDPENPVSVTKALGLLNDYSVSAVALVNSGAEFPSNLAMALERVPDWRPIYIDPYGNGFVFLRSDSKELNLYRETGKLDLYYPNKQSRLVSLAKLCTLDGKRVAPEALSELKKMARTNPTPMAYCAIADAMHVNSCMDESSRSYFIGEDDRLSKIKAAWVDAGYWVVRSRLEIMRILLDAYRTCPSGLPFQYSDSDIAALRRSINRMRAEFLPPGAAWQWP